MFRAVSVCAVPIWVPTCYSECALAWGDKTAQMKNAASHGTALVALVLVSLAANAGEIVVQHNDGGWAGNVKWTQRIRFIQNSAHQTVSLSGLNDDDTCVTPRRLDGRVIERGFFKDGVSLKDFVVEHSDGSRDDVSIPGDYSTEVIGEFPASVIRDGLQRLTNPGRVVRGRVVLCGADGSNATLDSIE